MCYSGRCLWEDYTGNCSYPKYILGDVPIKCNCTMQEYIDSKNEVTKYHENQKRKYKISKIKKKMSIKMDF